MKRLRSIVIIAALAVFANVAAFNIFTDTTAAAAPHIDSGCTSSSAFFGLPHWYDNLPLKISADKNSCSVVLNSPNDIWIIVLNAINIILRLTGIVAVLFIVVGGVRYIISQGESSGIAAAKQTIVRALTGLLITIGAVLIVTYISSVFGKSVNQNQNYKVSLVRSSADVRTV